MTSITLEPITLERVFRKANLMEALKSVERNKGSAGIDGMRTDELRSYIKHNPNKLTNTIMDGKYRPQPILRVYIPKDNGEQRPLGIPTVLDRLVQQALARTLTIEYEKVFSRNSFGFRPFTGCHDAISKASEYVNQGYEWVIDLDLSKFFDTVNHSKLLQILSNTIKDGRVISLIHRFLRAPICENGKVGNKTTIGTPQGGCISPILANILLNELDQLLDERERPFVRYADDMCIFCKSRKGAERVLAWVTKFLEEKLFLKVNKEKTKISKVGRDTQFLGFAFISSKKTTKARQEKYPGYKHLPIVHKKKMDKFKKKIKEILDRRAMGGIEYVKKKLAYAIRGWVNYFRDSIPKTWANKIDSWIRRRIRQLLWKQWKTPQNRYKEFAKRYAASPSIESKQVAYSSNRQWRMSKNRTIHTVLGNKTLSEEGWFTVGKALELLLCRES